MMSTTISFLEEEHTKLGPWTSLNSSNYHRRITQAAQTGSEHARLLRLRIGVYNNQEHYNKDV